jgi:DNA invertase Pin-like site-specific DNA recombinase
MTTESFRVGIYAAGETTAAVDGSLDALRAWAAEQSGWRVVEEYFDDLTTATRDDFDRLIDDAEAGRLDLVLFRSLAEFLPGGITATVRHLAGLGRHGVRFASRTEPHLTTLGDAGQLFARALRSIEAQERLRFGVHLRRRLDDARRDGHRGGRPRLPLETRRAIARLRREGRTVAATAQALGVAQSTVVKYQDSPIGDLLELLPDRAVRAIFGGRRD